MMFWSIVEQNRQYWENTSKQSYEWYYRWRCTLRHQILCNSDVSSSQTTETWVSLMLRNILCRKTHIQHLRSEYGLSLSLSLSLSPLFFQSLSSESIKTISLLFIRKFFDEMRIHLRVLPFFRGIVLFLCSFNSPTNGI